MKAYKGFNRDMTCRGFQYKEGETYETDEAKVCDCGFHACEHPLDCQNYYDSEDSVYHEVDLDGNIDRQIGGDTKVAATKIKIGARLSIAGIVKASVDYVMSNIKATTGYNAHAATTGRYANAATTGDCTQVEVKGSESVAVVTGRSCIARGGVGSWLVLTERDDENNIVGVKAFKIDGKKYKPDTWYTLNGGKVVEAEDGE